MQQEAKPDNAISIVICCYNSEPRLARVLNAIEVQQGCNNDLWEVIVVNNNSTDNTKQLAGDILSKPPFDKMQCKVVDEPEPGLSAAREKGFRTASFNYVLFCDDDNLVAPAYMKDALNLVNQYPEVDIFGSWCEGEFEIPPPSWSVRMLSSLAVGRPAKSEGFLNSPVNGACMLVKKNAYTSLKNNSFQFLLSDRKGNVLTSGGDTELCYAILLSKGKIYFSEQLYFTHLIPAARLTKAYFKKLYRIPAKQDFVGVMYQEAVKNNLKTFGAFYSRLLFIYCKTLAYCVKEMLVTGNLFYYTLLFKQRFSFFYYSLFHRKELRKDFNTIKALSEKLGNK
jgi:glycosyltransferase involved in cell wall biosynthesis